MHTTLDLFAGAGGMSLGFQRAGFLCGGAIEADRFAARTFQLNFSEAQLFNEDVARMTDGWYRSHFSGIDVLIGGPPCQGFSVAGPAQYGHTDDRNGLVMQMARVARLLKPRVVVMENVRGILRGTTPGGRPVFGLYESAMRKLKYVSRVFLLQAADFGIPETRERAFVVSASSPCDLPGDARFARAHCKERTTVRDAISDLPALCAGEGDEGPIPYVLRPKTAYQSRVRVNSKGVYNHVAMRHTPRLLERFKHIRPGESLVDVHPSHGQRARNSHVIDGNGRFKMNNTRLDWDCVSHCVTSSFQSTHLHPEQDRTITAREGARLQSFPDTFVFCGPRALPSVKLLEREGRMDEIGFCQYKQIGNAVPPFLAEVLAGAILSAMDGTETQ